MPSPFRLVVRSFWLCALSVAAFGCEQFDPVRTENLCDGPAPISMRCPQCQPPKYSWKCAECQGSNPDQAMCEAKPDTETETGENPATAAGRGGSGTGGTETGRGDSGEPEGGEGGAGSSGMDGGGDGQAGESGSGGMSTPGGGSGGSGGKAGMESTGCPGDLWCASMQGARPWCDPMSKRCVECFTDSQCDKVCNLNNNRCQTCVADADCPAPFRACRNDVCLECVKDEDCQGGDRDPTLTTCDTRTNTCVDCWGDNKGCSGVKGTCDQGLLTCVDCLTDGDCGADKPGCDVGMRTCVPCVADSHCRTNPDPTLRTCDTANHKCVDCTDDTGCSPGTHCDTEVMKCVECLNGSHCDTGHCVDQQCVECEDDGDCSSSNRARCNLATNTCTTCNNDNQCTRFSATRACDEGSGQCVECTNDDTCGIYSCIQDKRECSNVRKNSLGVCSECEADSMCQTNMRCVPLDFAGAPTGNYCVYLRTMRPSASCNNARPYAQMISRASIDNGTASFCIPPSTTTCPGVLSIASGGSGKGCQSASDCGLGIGDAFCSENKLCTYVCSGNELNCPSGMQCLPGGVCGGG